MATPSLSSSEVLHKLEEQLTCPICLEQYTNPKFLPCFHSFCSKCLRNVPLELQQGSYTLPCPTCRSPCQLPQQGVQALPSSFTINNFTKVYDLIKKVSGNRHASCDRCNSSDADRYCKQCAKFLCQPCLVMHNEWMTDHETLGLDEVVNTAYQLPQAKPEATSNCADHDKPLEIFCETCEELVCQLCTVKKHRDHDYDVDRDAYTKHKHKIESRLQPLKQNINRLSNALTGLVDRKEEIEKQGREVKGEVHQTVVQIKELLDQTEQKLNKEVDEAMALKLRVLEHQTKEATTVLSQLTDCWDHVQQSLKVGTPHQILTTKSQLTDRIEILSTSTKEMTFQPLEKSDLKLVKNLQKKLSEIPNFVGVVKYFTSMTKAKVSYAHLPLVGEASTVNVSLSCTDGTPVPVPSSLISCQLTQPTNPAPVQCTVKDTSSIGTYSVTFTPITRGTHQLQVIVQGSDITPVSVPVSIPAKMRGKVVKTIDKLNEPVAVTVSDDGSVIVREEGGYAISILDSKGDRLKSFRTNSKHDNNISYPDCCLAVTPKGTLLFTNINDNSLMEFSMAGQCISRVGSKGDGPLQFFRPIGIAINKTTGQVYVVDSGNDRVQVLNADLTFSHMFGSCGSDQGQFHYPHSIAIDSQGLMYVADGGNNRIQQFTPEGKHLSSFGTKGSAPGQLTFPCDIAVDDNDLLYICEGRPNSRVSVFTTTGELVHCFGQQLLGYPRRCALDKNGFLYVCDYEKNKVVVF